MAIRYPRGAGKKLPPFPPMQAIEPGRGRIISEGDGQIAVLSIGVTEAAEGVRLAAERHGVKATLCDMLWLRPLDGDLLRKIAGRCRRIITIEDGCRIGGFGSAILEWLSDNGYTNIEVTRLGLPDKFITQGTPSQLRQLCGIDAEAVCRAIIKEQ